METNKTIVKNSLAGDARSTISYTKCSSEIALTKKEFENDDENEKSEYLCALASHVNLDQSCSTLKDLINQLYKIFDSDCVNVEQVHALMSAYKSNPAEWLKYAKFDRYRYTRNLVDAGNGKFNLMVLCWGEGHGSSIHNHANSHCFMKMLAGELCEVRFEWPKVEEESEDVVSPMKEMSRKVLHTEEVCYINDLIGLHRVENLSYSDYAVSLHLYCPPLNSCKMFDARTGRSTTSKVTFWSLYGERSKAKSVSNVIDDE